MPLIDVLLPEYDRETDTTRRLLESIPDSTLDWKPHDTSMSLGELASHLVELPRWVDHVMTRDGFDLTSDGDQTEVGRPASNSTEQLVTRFDDSVARARTRLVDTIDGSLSAPWTLSRGKQELFRLPKIGVLRYFVLNHLVHHRGQLTVYLRIQGVPIPAIYGPAADVRGL